MCVCVCVCIYNQPIDNPQKTVQEPKLRGKESWRRILHPGEVKSIVQI
jgi:hypothetical protein